MLRRRDASQLACRLFVVTVMVMCVKYSTCALLETDTVEAIQEEVCHSSLFKASCPDGHVMFVQSARYGRFRTSRCITEGLGYLGCETNVLHVIDSLCSGRPSCEVKVEDATFYGVIPCHNDVKSHLSITYSCLKVVTPLQRCPPVSKPVIDVSEGYIASHMTDTSGCGSTDSPWVLRAPSSSQRFNVTLVDFLYNSSVAMTTRDSLRNDITDNMCRVYATIREPLAALTPTTVCSQRQRYRQVHLSTSNTLEIRLLRPHQQLPAYYLLHFQVLGCPDLAAPTDGWVRRVGRQVQVGCDDNTDTVRWTLDCVANRWRGNHGNCSQVAIGRLTHDAPEDHPLTGLSLFIILIIAVVVSILIIVLGIFLLKRKFAIQKRPVYLVPGEPSLYAPRGSSLRRKSGGKGGPDYACQSAVYPAPDYSAGRLLAMREQLHQSDRVRLQHPNTLPYRPLYDPRRGGGSLLCSPEHLYESPEVLRAGFEASRDSVSSRQYYDVDPGLAVHGVMALPGGQGHGHNPHKAFCTCTTGRPTAAVQSPRQQNNYSI